MVKKIIRIRQSSFEVDICGTVPNLINFQNHNISKSSQNSRQKENFWYETSKKFWKSFPEFLVHCYRPKVAGQFLYLVYCRKYKLYLKIIFYNKYLNLEVESVKILVWWLTLKRPVCRSWDIGYSQAFARQTYQNNSETEKSPLNIIFKECNNYKWLRVP